MYPLEYWHVPQQNNIYPNPNRDAFNAVEARKYGMLRTQIGGTYQPIMPTNSLNEDNIAWKVSPLISTQNILIPALGRSILL